MRTYLTAAALGAALLTGASQAQAGLLGLSVDIAVNLGVTQTIGAGACKLANVVDATVGAAYELQAEDYIDNGCSGLVLIDITDDSIVFQGLRQDNVGDYFWMTAEITLPAGTLTSASLGASNLFVTPSPLNGAPAFLPTPTVSISGGGSKLTIVWSAIGTTEGVFELRDQGTETFFINGGGGPGGEVSEPATLALLGAGLLGLAAVRRRR